MFDTLRLTSSTPYRVEQWGRPFTTCDLLRLTSSIGHRVAMAHTKKKQVIAGVCPHTMLACAVSKPYFCTTVSVSNKSPCKHASKAAMATTRHDAIVGTHLVAKLGR